MNRRQFIVGSTAFSFAPNPFAYQGERLRADEVKLADEKSVIYIFLGGGISATEYINPIPQAPVEFRGVNGFVKTKGGYLLGGDLQNLATIGDKLSVVRSFHHSDASHASATLWTNTSHRHLPQQSQQEPSYGSIVSHSFGANKQTGMPSYIKTRDVGGTDAAWLGATHGGYSSRKEAVGNLVLKTSKQRFSDKLDLRQRLDTSSLQGNTKNWDELSKQASTVIRGSVAEAFDVSLESEKTRARYSGSFGTDLLLAKRLTERGASFVTLSHGGWDQHSNISKSFSARMADLDRQLTYLIQDLEDEGRLDNTLIVTVSEFSRTPKLNGSNPSGRDHYPSINSLVFAGGGHSHGRVIGKTNKNASSVISDPFYPTDLAWTIGNHFGIDKSLEIMDATQRPRHMFEHEAKNILA